MTRLSGPALISEAFAFARRHIGLALVWGMPLLAFMLFQAEVERSGRTFASVLAAMPTWLASSALLTALLRSAFRDEPVRLRFAQAEWQVALTTLLISLLQFLILMVVAGSLFYLVVATTIGAGIAQISNAEAFQSGLENMGPAMALVALAILLAGVLGMLWLAVRLTAAPAATFATGRIQVLSALPITKGQFWAIFVAWVVIILATILATLVASSVLALALIGGGVSLEPLSGGDVKAGVELISAHTWAARVWVGLNWLITAGVVLPLSAGLGVAVYKGAVDE